MRCLTLAEALKQRGALIHFVSRHLPEHLRDMLAAKGHEFMLLSSRPNKEAIDGLSHAHWLGTSQHADAQASIQALSDQTWDWLVVDHYALDFRWESALRPSVGRIMVIDDLADRVHDCDLLLDQNYYRDLDRRYHGLVPEQCVTLLGPAYVLLRPEFADARQRLRLRDGSVRRILVFFGGSDPANQTQMAIKALQLLDRPDIEVDVVVGAANPNRNAIQAMCDQLPNVAFHCQVSNMAELILNADLGIGAGGATMWERCCLGLPAITVVSAANQERATEDVAGIGAIEYLGWFDQLGPEDYAQAISRMLGDAQRVRQIGNAALRVLQPGAISLADEMQRLLLEPEKRRSPNHDHAVL
jgi:UDP-2,4-diacetamido-2,4,6-trideoxy-beta-L-altropyranose hydrolase